VQLLRITIVLFFIIFSHFTFSTNLVNTVSTIPLKSFHQSLPTIIPGQYIEYSESLLTIRQYNNQGLHQEFSVELSGYSNNNSAFQAYLDSTSSAIWITGNHFDIDEGVTYIIVEKFVFNDEGFTGEYRKMQLPNSLTGVIRGFNNNNMYIVTEDTSTGSLLYNFTEYDLSNELLKKRSLQFDNNFGSRISPSGDYFVTTKGIISLTGTEIEWIDSGLNAGEVPFFINNDTILFKNEDVGYYIGSINNNIVSTSLLLSNNSSKLQYETRGYTYHRLNEERVINFYDNDDGLISSFSIDKVNNVWGVSDVELGTDINAYSQNYKRTSESGLINRNWSFSHIEGKWLQDKPLVKGYEYDTGYVFVSNMDDVQDNELYAIFTGDVNRLRKLEFISNNEYQWNDIDEIPKQKGNIKFSSKYMNKIYVVSVYWDGSSQTIDALSTIVRVINTDGEFVTEVEFSGVIGADSFVVNNINPEFIFWGHLKCSIQYFTCENFALLPINTSTIYYNGFLYYYSDTDNKLHYYNTATGGVWNTSSFEFPEGSSSNFQKFGNQLRFDENLVVFNESGEIDSLMPIISANTDYITIFSENNFNNGTVSCDDRLVNCISIDGRYTLEFSSINSDTWGRYKNINGTPFFYDPFEYFHTLEVFKTKENLIFPTFQNLMPRETEEILQDEDFSISLNDYFNNITHYEHVGKEYNADSDYIDEFIADTNGNLQITVTNEHTWKEHIIPFSTYTGYNENFTMPVYPMSIIVKDINDPPELREGKSLTINPSDKDNIHITLDDIFWDPERKRLEYVITNLPLSNGLKWAHGGVRGSAKPGIHNVNLTVTDTSLDELTASFTLKIQIKDEKGNIPTKKDSSGGSLGWSLLFLTLLVIFRNNLHLYIVNSVYERPK